MYTLNFNSRNEVKIVKSFEENLALISQREVPDLIAEMEVGEAPFSYLGTDEDDVKIFCDHNNQPFVIDPRVDESQLPNPNLKQLIFLFGIVSLVEIQKAATHANKDSLFVIIEPNPYFFQHALYFEDFHLLHNLNYIIVTEDVNNLSGLFKLLFSSRFFYLLRNVTFYLNYYYRNYDSASVIKYIKEIKSAIQHRYFTIGNSIQDSLVGLINNLNNIKALSENVDVAELKDAFSGVPAFVVAAGPSLDKNIKELKSVQGKGIIIAVDTIAKKLLDNGIIPNFIATVERGAIVWEYFYENQEYPPNLYLLSSLVADPRIVDKFKHRAVLPMRNNVREYFWLSEKLGLTQDHFIWMGGSSAHIAAGFALHIGASPIVLVGQDLAYGEKGTHANGTVYDKKPLDEKNEEWIIEGYYGGQVRTREIWIEFKQIFEEIFKHTQRLIINATEGGAKIEGTTQCPLHDVVKEYCTQECSVYERMRKLPKGAIDWRSAEEKVNKYIECLERSRLNLENHSQVLKRYHQDWKNSMSEKKVNKIYKTMKKTDQYLNMIRQDELLYHNLQGPLAILIQKFQSIEENDSLKSLKGNLEVQIELCEMMENTMWLIIQVIRENFPWNQTGHSL